MNIFCTSDDPVLAAEYLDDKRVPKLCVETAQILSTALFRLGYWKSNLYQPTHNSHPCVTWTRASRGNFNWLVLHGLALGEEYKVRFPYALRDHRSVAVILNCAERGKAVQWDETTRTPFANCTNLSGRTGIVALYRQYMIETKWDGKNPRWTNRGEPDWYTKYKLKAAW